VRTGEGGGSVCLITETWTKRGKAAVSILSFLVAGRKEGGGGKEGKFYKISISVETCLVGVTGERKGGESWGTGGAMS